MLNNTVFEKGMWVRVQDLGFWNRFTIQFQGFGFRASLCSYLSLFWGLRFGFRVKDLGCRVQRSGHHNPFLKCRCLFGFRLRIQNLGFRVQDLGFVAYTGRSPLRFRVQAYGFGFRVQNVWSLKQGWGAIGEMREGWGGGHTFRILPPPSDARCAEIIWSLSSSYSHKERRGKI